MAEFKLNIGNPKDGKTHKKDIAGDEAQALIGKKLGDKVTGKTIGFDGYEFEITGGSDYCGFPMRKDVIGQARKKVLATKGVGMRDGRKGLRLRKMMAGNQVYERTSQINLKVLKEGKAPLGEAPAEETPAEKQE